MNQSDPHAAAVTQANVPAQAAPPPADQQGNSFRNLEELSSESDYDEAVVELDSSNLASFPAAYTLAGSACTVSITRQHRVARKWARKCANRASRKVRCTSARLATTPPRVTWADVVASRPPSNLEHLEPEPIADGRRR